MSTPIERYDAAMLLVRNGSPTEAVNALKSLTEEEPDFALAHNALGAFHKKGGDIIAAIRCAETYCQLEPEDSFGFSILSSYCLAGGMRDEAEDALGRAQELRFKAQFNNS